MKSRMLRIPMLFVWLLFGMALILVPWSDLWDTNYFLYHYPVLGIFVKNPFLRGTISGLGFMNVLMSLEAFRHTDAAVARRT
jgi:hypothetical protein